LKYAEKLGNDADPIILLAQDPEDTSKYVPIKAKANGDGTYSIETQLMGSNIAYDNNSDVLKMSSIHKKWRDNFRGPSLNLDKWEIVQQGAGQILDLSGFNMVASAGIEASAATILRSKEIFNFPLRLTFGHKLSQRIANQSFIVELISVDDNGAPDNKDMIAVSFDGTTATYCTLYSKCDGQAIWFTPNVTTLATNSDAIQEIEVFSDEAWFHSRGLNSVSARSNSKVEQTVIPNPNSRYKLQIRIYNSSTPPASNTNWTLYFVNAIEFSELTTEITASRGGKVGGMGMPVTIPDGVAGATSHDSPITSAPVRIGGRAITANYTGVATGDTADLVTTTVGALIQKPYSIPNLDWQFACSSPIANTADVALVAAGAAGIRNYVTCLQYQNTNATATEVVVKNGSTVIWLCYAPANMAFPALVSFPTPLKGTAATVMNFACITTGANVYVNAQGYQAP